MRTRSLKDLIRYEATRKPDIADLLARAPEMTEEEIDAAQVPLPWYRQALKEIRRDALKEITYANTMEAILPYVVDVYYESPIGVMHEWLGGDTFVTLDGRSTLLIMPGKLLWFPKTGGVWIETVFANNIDPQLISHSRIVRECTKAEYTDAYKARIATNCPIDAPVIASNAPDTPAGRLAGLGVRISR